jgi:hypothetical protein
MMMMMMMRRRRRMIMSLMMMMMMMTAANKTEYSVFCHVLRQTSDGVCRSLLRLLAACIHKSINGFM